MERVTLNVKLREDTGKSAVKKIRQEGLIPAVVYAKKETPINLTVDRREFIKLLHKQGENAIIDLTLSQDKNSPENKTVLIKDIQFDTIKEEIFHVDFQQIKLTDKIRVHIPLRTQGDADAPGVKEGGILEHILREIEIECLPTNIPKEILVDVSGLNIGNSVHVRDLKVDAGIKIIDDLEQVAVLVKFAAEEKVEEEQPEEGEQITEPEVIKKGKPEEAAEEEKDK
ncbi:MAG: 50S ribosomal protein L25 [Candidatus Omnitrophota bacterium]